MLSFLLEFLHLLVLQKCCSLVAVDQLSVVTVCPYFFLFALITHYSNPFSKTTIFACVCVYFVLGFLHYPTYYIEVVLHHCTAVELSIISLFKED